MHKLELIEIAIANALPDVTDLHYYEGYVAGRIRDLPFIVETGIYSIYSNAYGSTLFRSSNFEEFVDYVRSILE